MRAVRRAQEKGHRIFLCTGRNRGMLQPVFSLGFEGAVASAGGYVFVGDRVLFDCPMTEEQRLTALRLFQESGVLRTIEARDQTWGDEDLADFFARLNGGKQNSEMERWHKQLAQELNIRPMREYEGQPLYKIVFMCQDVRQLLPARQALEEDFQLISVCMANGSPALKAKSDRICPAVTEDGLARAFEELGLVD